MTLTEYDFLPDKEFKQLDKRTSPKERAIGTTVGTAIRWGMILTSSYCSYVIVMNHWCSPIMAWFAAAAATGMNYFGFKRLRVLPYATLAVWVGFAAWGCTNPCSANSTPEKEVPQSTNVEPATRSEEAPQPVEEPSSQTETAAPEVTSEPAQVGGGTVLAVPSEPQQYAVVKGDNLHRIAERYGLWWEEILLANETYLQGQYDQVCGTLSEGYRTRRQGYFCNDRFNRPYGNTLKPGWMLSIPSETSTPEITRIVQNTVGSSIAIVIDDTGSMDDDRQEAGELYLAAVRQAGKKLTGIWLYADGEVRRYRNGNVEFRATGGFENTYGALKTAAESKPDTIILITDERGDDWPDDPSEMHLPNVVVHCLGYDECGGIKDLEGPRFEVHTSN